MKAVRTPQLLIAVLIISLIQVSCGNKDKSNNAEDRLGKMEVVIPDELKDNPEIVEYIESMSEIADEYAVLLDNMVVKLDGIAGKDWEDLNMREQIKLTTTAAEFAMKSAPVTAKWAESEMKRSMFDDDLSEDELLALETVMLRFEKRMEQIEEKNKAFFEGVQ